jgi:hypothetical protein
MRRTAPVCLVWLVALTACGGGNGNSPSPVGSLSGNWQMVLEKNSNANLSKTQSGFLLQAGASLSGGVVISGNCSGTGPAQGQVNGSNVTISVNQTDQTVNLTGTATSDGGSMSGNYSILSSGCGTSEIGTWTASQVKPLKGNLQGTFTSTLTPGVVFHFTGSVTQGSNTGASNATLSGSMTSTDAPSCFDSVSITGLISGTSVVFNFLASDGTALGAYLGSATTDASALNGNYNFFNAQSPILMSCGGGDFGTVTFTVQ